MSVSLEEMLQIYKLLQNYKYMASNMGLLKVDSLRALHRALVA